MVKFVGRLSVVVVVLLLSLAQFSVAAGLSPAGVTEKASSVLMECIKPLSIEYGQTCSSDVTTLITRIMTTTGAEVSMYAIGGEALLRRSSPMWATSLSLARKSTERTTILGTTLKTSTGLPRGSTWQIGANA